jgi:DNA-binding transcriptional MerR regulator
VSGEGWTIDELARHTAEALVSEGVRAPNGRVSAAPDRRVIRWYATIGLLDPPLRTRGRTARYGERHLLQLVAVKRRQAEGHPLAKIQAELAGATDATLRQVAALPAGPDRRHFWRAPATSPTASPTAGPAAPVTAVAPVYPVPLHPAATLTLPAAPTADDLAAIQAAARPLLDLLAARGLLPHLSEPSAARRPA